MGSNEKGHHLAAFHSINSLNLIQWNQYPGFCTKLGLEMIAVAGIGNRFLVSSPEISL